MDDGATGRGKRGARRWLTGLALATLAGVGVWLLVTRAREPQPGALRAPENPAFERAVARRLETLRELSEFRERFDGLPAAEQRNAVMELAVRGMPRLEDPQLLERVALLTRMLDGVNAETCGAIVRGRPTPAQLERAVSALDEGSVEAWVGLCFRAAEAELRNTTATPLDPARTKLAIVALLRRFPADEAARLAAALGQLTEQSDVEACWAARTVYHQVPSLDDPHDRMLARLLARN